MKPSKTVRVPREQLDDMIDAIDGLLTWCVANVDRWNFYQYDHLHRSREKLRVFARREKHKQMTKSC